LIKGMKMPKGCTYCPMLEGDSDDGLCHAASRWLDDDEYWLWYQYPEGDIDTSKPSNCPLTPVPTPHGRLIDADVFDRHMKQTPRYFSMCCDLEEQPTIIEAEEVAS